MGGAIAGSWLYNSLFNNHYYNDISNSNISNSDTNNNKESSNEVEGFSSWLWSWVHNTVEYLRHLLFRES